MRGDGRKREIDEERERGGGGREKEGEGGREKCASLLICSRGHCHLVCLLFVDHPPPPNPPNQKELPPARLRRAANPDISNSRAFTSLSATPPATREPRSPTRHRSWLVGHRSSAIGHRRGSPTAPASAPCSLVE